ncbi:MAG TPA: hypothetical protein VG265_04530 [Gaiellaceae bacterium]|nr:hypothetical protein [Gaiellaceae bacterium]
MTAFMRRFTVVAAVFAAAAVIVSSGGAAPATSSTSTLPTLYFTYAMNCTFTIVDDSGKTVSQVAPGLYQVDVRTPVAFGTVPLSSYGTTDMTACKGFPQFQMTGPGVSLSTTMTAGCQSDLTFPETLEPNSTYVAVDNNQPTVARAVLTTTASGTPQKPTATYGGGATHSETSTDLVGSGNKTVMGTITATLSASGSATLTLESKAVSKVTAGVYTFTVVDRSAKSGFSLLGPKMKAKADLTGVKYVGKHSKNVTLSVGRWLYITGKGAMHPFVVTAAK